MINDKTFDDPFALANVKIVINGEPSVGKTSLRRTYVGEKFRNNYIETIGSDFSYTSIVVKGLNIGLSLWDLAGQDKFKRVHPIFYKGAFGCIVVYSVVDKNSFDAVEGWVDRFIEFSNREDLPIMIIGNKVDLLESSEVESIANEELEALLNSLRSKYNTREILSFYTSAMTGENVETGFKRFAEAVYNWFVKYAGMDKSIKIEIDLDKHFPGAYLLVMNQVMGPQVVSVYPPIKQKSDEAIKITNSCIKLIASLDFDNIISQSSLISTYPWMEPQGDYHYIAFVLENSNARGSKELFIIGINIDRELEETIAGIKGVLNGFLHSAMNRFARLAIESNIDIVTQEFNPREHVEFLVNCENILKELRSKTYESILRWYNINK